MGATETETRILDAAGALIARHGYAGASTAEIARQAGVNEVTLFRRFGSKMGVLCALRDRIGSETAGAAALKKPVGNADQVLRRLARAEFESARRNGGLALRLAFDASSIPEVREVMGTAAPANLESLAVYFASLQESGTLRDDVDSLGLAEAFFALTSSYVMYRLFLAGDEKETQLGVDQLADVFWSGARADRHAHGGLHRRNG